MSAMSICVSKQDVGVIKGYKTGRGYDYLVSLYDINREPEHLPAKLAFSLSQPGKLTHAP